jgi:hypothetical protein
MAISTRNNSTTHQLNRDRAIIWSGSPSLWCKEVHDWTPDPWQAKFLESNKRRLCLKCCRQSGKSTVVGYRVAHRATFRPKYFCVCTAPSDRQVLELFTKIREPLRRAGELDERPAKDNMHELVLPNGSRIVCLPSSADTIRGFSAADEILFDEAAMVEDQVFGAVEPMMMRSRGGLVYMSTPKGQRGHFHSVWSSGKNWERFDVDYREVLSYGHFSQEDLDDFRQEHGEWMFRQEFGCEFLSTLDAVFPLEQIKMALDETGEVFEW